MIDMWFSYAVLIFIQVLPGLGDVTVGLEKSESVLKSIHESKKFLTFGQRKLRKTGTNLPKFELGEPCLFTCSGVLERVQARVSFSERMIWVISEEVHKIQEQLKSSTGLFEVLLPPQEEKDSEIRLQLLNVTENTGNSSVSQAGIEGPSIALCYSLMCEDNVEHVLEVEHIWLSGLSKFESITGTKGSGYFIINTHHQLNQKDWNTIERAFKEKGSSVIVQPRKTASYSTWFKVSDLTFTNDKLTLKFERIEETPQELNEHNYVRSTITFNDDFGKPYIARGVDMKPDTPRGTKLLYIKEEDGHNQAIMEYIYDYVYRKMKERSEAIYGHDLNFTSIMTIIRREGTSGGHVKPNKVMGIGDLVYITVRFDGPDAPLHVQLKISFFNLAEPYENFPVGYIIKFPDYKKPLRVQLNLNEQILELDATYLETFKKEGILHDKKYIATRRPYISLEDRNVNLSSKKSYKIQQNQLEQYELTGFEKFDMKIKPSGETVLRFGFTTCEPMMINWTYRFVKVTGKAAVYGVKWDKANNEMTWIKDSPWCNDPVNPETSLVYGLKYLGELAPKLPALLVSDAYADFSRQTLVGNNRHLLWSPMSVIAVTPSINTKKGEINTSKPVTISLAKDSPVFEKVKLEQTITFQHIVIFPPDSKLPSLFGTAKLDEGGESYFVLEVPTVSHFYSNVDIKIESNWAESAKKNQIEAAMAKTTKGKICNLLPSIMLGKDKGVVEQSESNEEPKKPIFDKIWETFQEAKKKNEEFSICTEESAIIGVRNQIRRKVVNIDRKQCEYGLPILIITCDSAVLL